MLPFGMKKKIIFRTTAQSGSLRMQRSHIKIHPNEWW